MATTGSAGGRHRQKVVVAIAGAAVALVVVVAVVVVVAGDSGEDGADVLVAGAELPSALVALPEGGLRYAELRTGRIRQVGPDGELADEVVAEVELGSTEGQRGLLGLAVDDGDRTFAAWVRPDDRLVVGQVAPGPTRLVWEGPPSAELANGGRLAFAADGALVVGIGDLQEPDRVTDPTAPNGKLLALDRDGPPDQVPEVLSLGWNNPFAFAFTPSGDLWVADNAPGERPERLARGQTGGPPGSVTELEGRAAPSGLAAVSDTRLAVCGFVSGELRFYDVGGTEARLDEAATVEGCTLGVVVLADGRLAVAEEDAIRVLEP